MLALITLGGIGGGCGPTFSHSCEGHSSEDRVCMDTWTDKPMDFGDYGSCVKGFSGSISGSPCKNHGAGGCGYDWVSLTLSRGRFVRW